jgi:hypothetical protein
MTTLRRVSILRWINVGSSAAKQERANYQTIRLRLKLRFDVDKNFAGPRKFILVRKKLRKEK